MLMDHLALGLGVYSVIGGPIVAVTPSLPENRPWEREPVEGRRRGSIGPCYAPWQVCTSRWSLPREAEGKTLRPKGKAPVSWDWRPKLQL